MDGSVGRGARGLASWARPEALPPQASRSAIVTVALGAHEELVDIARPHLRRYAVRHSLDLHVVTDPIAPERPASWTKVLVLRELLNVYERVAVIDADTVIVNGADDITRLPTRLRPIALVAHKYDGLTIPNLGVMAVRRSFTTMRMLEHVWNLTEYVDHKWWENAAMLDLLGYDVEEPRAETRRRTLLHARIRWLDVAWNSIDLHASPAPRIMHFPGTTHAERIARMRRAAEQAARADW